MTPCKLLDCIALLFLLTYYYLVRTYSRLENYHALLWKIALLFHDFSQSFKLNCGKSYLFLSRCMDAPRICNHISKGESINKNLIHGRPPASVMLLGDTTTSSMRKAISARRSLLSKTNYKNIILEIYFYLKP